MSVKDAAPCTQIRVGASLVLFVCSLSVLHSATATALRPGNQVFKVGLLTGHQLLPFFIFKNDELFIGSVHRWQLIFSSNGDNFNLIRISEGTRPTGQRRTDICGAIQPLHIRLHDQHLGICQRVDLIGRPVRWLQVHISSQGVPTD